MKSYMFCDITPCSAVKFDRSFGGTCRQQNTACCILHAGFLHGLYVSALLMETICSFGILVDFHRTTRRCIQEDSTVHSHRFENFKYNIS
jgi:hypothetical protein